MHARPIHLLAVLCTVAATASSTAFGQASSTSPAALLTFPYLTISRDAGVDTLVQITNTGDAPVEVRCVLEDATPQCVGGTGTCADNQCSGVCQPTHAATPFRIRLTAHQPIGWTLHGGLSAPPIASTGGSGPNGESDVGTQIPAVAKPSFLGVLRCVAVDDYGAPVERNVLTGTASIERFDAAASHIDATSYNAIGVAALPSVASGSNDDWLALGGGAREYAPCAASLALPVIFDGATVGGATVPRTTSTTLALVPCGGNFLGDIVGGSTAQFLVYNEFSQRFSTSTSFDAQLVSRISRIDTQDPTRSIMSVGVNGTIGGQVLVQAPVNGGVLGVALERHASGESGNATHLAALDVFSEGARAQGEYAGLLSAPCAGDCNGDGRVTIDELLLAVNIALESKPVAACGLADGNHNGAVIVNELTAAVAKALSNCPARRLSFPSPAATGTPTPRSSPSQPGPQITYLGIASPDDVAQQPIGSDDEGRPIYRWPVGQGLSLIIEARPGTDTLRVGTTARAGVDTELPDLQVILSRPLGDGSETVCDADFPNTGGVPAVQPFDFATEGAAVAINDLGCRADDGLGMPVSRGSRYCTRNEETRLIEPAAPGAQAQFCIPIAKAWAFPEGDTIVAARVRSISGQTGPEAAMVVRIDPAP